MEESEIAKEGKSFVLSLDKDSRPQCLLHDDRVGKFVKQWRQQINHADKIFIVFGKLCLTKENLCEDRSHPNFGREVGLIISSLPMRFD